MRQTIIIKCCPILDCGRLRDLHLMRSGQLRGLRLTPRGAAIRAYLAEQMP